MFLDFCCCDVLCLKPQSWAHREEEREICQAVGSSHDLVPVPGSKVQREEQQKGIKPTGNGDGRLACLTDVWDLLDGEKQALGCCIFSQEQGRIGEMQPEPEEKVFTSAFWPGPQRKGTDKKMAKVCSQEEGTEIAPIIGKRSSY